MASGQLLFCALLLCCVIHQVVSIALAKGQLSQTVASRLASCRIIGQICASKKVDAYWWVSCVYLVCIPVGESVFVCVITAYLLQDQTGPVATSHFTLPRCWLWSTILYVSSTRPYRKKLGVSVILVLLVKCLLYCCVWFWCYLLYHWSGMWLLRWYHF